MTKRLPLILALFALVFALFAYLDGTEDGSAEVIGAWKSVEDKILGLPYTILIDKKTLVHTESGNINVSFKKQDNKIIIMDTKKVHLNLLYL